MKFRNPYNNYVETAGTPLDCLGAFLLGPLYYAIRGCWSQVGIHAVMILAFGIFGPKWAVAYLAGWIAQAVNAPNEVNKRYRRMGWIKV